MNMDFTCDNNNNNKYLSGNNMLGSNYLSADLYTNTNTGQNNMDNASHFSSPMGLFDFQNSNTSSDMFRSQSWTSTDRQQMMMDSGSMKSSASSSNVFLGMVETELNRWFDGVQKGIDTQRQHLLTELYKGASSANLDVQQFFKQLVAIQSNINAAFGQWSSCSNLASDQQQQQQQRCDVAPGFENQQHNHNHQQQQQQQQHSQQQRHSQMLRKNAYGGSMLALETTPISQKMSAASSMSSLGGSVRSLVTESNYELFAESKELNSSNEELTTLTISTSPHASSPISSSCSTSSPALNSPESNNNNCTDSEIASYKQHLKPSMPSPSNKIYRLKMHYCFKFGGMGMEDNRFTEPNGLAFNANNDIIVADSNSNQVKVFDANGQFKFKFSHAKLLFPNRVACHKPTGNIVIIERKPAHEIKVFSQSGELMRRFGNGLLKSPRALCIDRHAHIIVLESKVMRVLIFDIRGILLRFFDISKHFLFANSVCASHTKDEIFITDNHMHCIKVFDYEGNLLRELGGQGLTNYPTSVDMNSNGELLVTDNYNSFNLTILSQHGELINAYESKMKHSRVLDVAFMNNDSVLFSTRDNHIYMYNYANCMI